VYCVFEHVVHEVGVGLDELVEHLQTFELLSFLVVEEVEVDFVGVELHVFEGGHQVVFMFNNFFVALLQLLLLLLKRADLLVYLLFHHLVQILLLNLELLHDAAERLLETVNFFIELLAHFQLEFGVEFFAGRRLTFKHFDFGDHFLHHPFHVNN